MRIILLCTTVLFSTLVMAGQDILTYGSCQTLSYTERKQIELLDASYTEEAAKKAIKELNHRISAKMQDDLPSSSSTIKLTRIVEGWLIKKDWLSARVKHDHDADEGTYYCGTLIFHARNNRY